MTKAQAKALEDIREHILRHDCYGIINRQNEYEIKEWTVEDTSYGYIILSTVTGRINDQGTMASILCRNYRQIFIGKNGGLRTYTHKSGEKSKKLTGWFNVMCYGVWS